MSNKIMAKGRGNSSALTIRECIRLNINSLKRSKSISKGTETTFISNWTSGAKIKGVSKYTDTIKELTLIYSYKSKPIESKIEITEVKSNLGKGVNLYFICPVTGNRCKTLFCCYGSEIFKSAKAYNSRIYYSYQLASKPYNTPSRYFNLEKKIEALRAKSNTYKYKGKPTKLQQRLNKLYDKLSYLQKKKDEELEEYLMKHYIGYY